MPARLLQSSGGSSAAAAEPAEPPEPIQVDSDVVVILASLLCALISVVGLALVARCAWLRRSLTAAPPPPPPPNKGLKKRALKSLPKVPFASAGGRPSECPICLAVFEEGEEVRILPQCGHWFHVGCVDTWLGSHSSCPSCRQILVVPAPAAAPSRCRQCGASSTEEADEVKAREDPDANCFLP